jgi:hypothetical protein
MIGAALLLAPSILSAVGFYWMSSGRAHGISTEASVDFLLFIPWQTLSLTIVKCGIDTWMLSRAGQWAGRSLSLRFLVAKRYLPIALVVGVALLARLPVLTCIVAGVSALFDAVALVMVNELAAHTRVAAAGAANLTKYPLFFLLVFVIAYIGPVDINLLLGLFLLTSVVRLCWLVLMRSQQREREQDWPNTARLAAQQVLNYGLFKNDQLTMGLANGATAAGNALFVYLARFPELISAIVTATGPMLYPRLHSKRSNAGVVGVTPDRNSAMMAVLIVGAAVIYATTAAGPLSQGLWPLLPAVVLHSLLIVPVNYRTYALLREQKDSELVSGLLKANLVGVAIIVVAATFLAPLSPAVLWIIPVQQVAFLGITHGVRGMAQA